MKRFSLLLGVFVLVLWSFCIAGHATHNFEKMPAALFDLDHSDWHFKHGFEPGLHYQNDVTYISAETVPISDSGILLIFAIGLVLVWVSRFGEKFFKNKKR
jgi:hypothetical protein